MTTLPTISFTGFNFSIYGFAGRCSGKRRTDESKFTMLFLFRISLDRVLATLDSSAGCYTWHDLEGIHHLSDNGSPFNGTDEYIETLVRGLV